MKKPNNQTIDSRFFNDEYFMENYWFYYCESKLNLLNIVVQANILDYNRIECSTDVAAEMVA